MFLITAKGHIQNLFSAFVFPLLFFTLYGCASMGSYRVTRLPEDGNWEITPFVGYPDIMWMKFYYGIGDRGEFGFGIFSFGANIEGKVLILDEKSANNFMSLALDVGANNPVV